ncbi:OsmC family protein [Chelativorans sp. Marseille-P2723]|uniref:OsmC family protein n=1 Tax=Chelativorans sp. Marseille-P2723 TaxID=2709133 RepID=UPI00156FA1AE|nr:OsmC family protein [Chelativorans sp. Marseille-P2723]
MAVKSAKVHARSETAATCKLTNDRHQEIAAVFSTQARGFTPLELQAAALAACICASVRIAANNLKIGRLKGIDVEVEAVKAEDAPSRLATFHCIVKFEDDLDDETQEELVEAAEHICTISNTLRAGATILARPQI